MPRYFFTEQAATPFVVSGRTYNFTPTGVVSGRLAGVFLADNDQSLADMLALVGRGAVEIDLVDFEIEKKKENRNNSAVSSPSNNRVVAPSALQSLSIQEKAGVARAAGESPKVDDDITALPSPESLIKVTRVTPIHPLVKASDRTANKSKITP